MSNKNNYNDFMGFIITIIGLFITFPIIIARTFSDFVKGVTNFIIEKTTKL